MIVFAIFVLLLSSACHGDYTVELSGGYYYYSESKTDEVIVPHGWKPGIKYIPCNVTDYDWDDNFIIAQQIAEKECWWEKEYIVSQKIGQAYYWIIEVGAKKIHGPFKMDQFKKQRKLLGVPANLDLNM